MMHNNIDDGNLTITVTVKNSTTMCEGFRSFQVFSVAHHFQFVKKSNCKLNLSHFVSMENSTFHTSEPMMQVYLSFYYKWKFSYKSRTIGILIEFTLITSVRIHAKFRYHKNELKAIVFKICLGILISVRIKRNFEHFIFSCTAASFFRDSIRKLIYLLLKILSMSYKFISNILRTLPNFYAYIHEYVSDKLTWISILR